MTVSAKTRTVSKPELTFIVGLQEKIYKYDSSNFVKHSKYIRTYLVASLMSGKNNPMTVYLPDIRTSVWDQMIKYLDPKENLNVFDAASLREWYLRYGFEERTRICDRALFGVIGGVLYSGG